MIDSTASSTANYVSNTLISEPVPTGYTLHANMGGFGWDQDQGLFVPLNGGELEPFSAPAADPNA